MEYKTIKVYASVCDHSTVYEVEVAIPKDEWERELDNLAEEVDADIDNYIYMEGQDEYHDFVEGFKDSTGYIDGLYGHSHDCNSDQARMAYHLQSFGADVDVFLDHCDALGTLRDALVRELETNHPEKIREIYALKNISDLDEAMVSHYRDEDDEEWICHIYCRYPLELLDDLDRRMRQKYPNFPYLQ